MKPLWVLFPFLGIPVGLLIVKFPLFGMILAIGAGLLAIALMVVGFLLILKGNKVADSGPLRYKDIGAQDAMRILQEEYRHRNAQDGKY